MYLKEIKDLDIAKGTLRNTIEIRNDIDYQTWVDFITRDDYFVWYENTREGKRILEKSHSIPDDFKQSILSTLNKVRCFADFNSKKNIYELSLGFNMDAKRVAITFNRTPTKEDIIRFLNMAKHLDALLLKDGSEIIDEETIKGLK